MCFLCSCCSSIWISHIKVEVDSFHNLLLTHLIKYESLESMVPFNRFTQSCDTTLWEHLRCGQKCLVLPQEYVTYASYQCTRHHFIRVHSFRKWIFCCQLESSFHVSIATFSEQFSLLSRGHELQEMYRPV